MTPSLAIFQDVVGQAKTCSFLRMPQWPALYHLLAAVHKILKSLIYTFIQAFVANFWLSAWKNFI